MTLLDKARAHTRRSKYSDITEEHIELALAWAHDQIGMKQVAIALGFGKVQGGAYSILARALKAHLQKEEAR